MRKNIFVFFFLLAGMGTAFAQAQDDAYSFPDLSFDFEQEEITDSQPEEETNGEETDLVLEESEVVENTEEQPSVVENQPVQSEELKTDVTEQNVEEVEEETEEEEEEEKFIYLALNNVKSHMSVIKSVSYCSAEFILYNDTKRVVQEVSGTLGIGDQKKKFEFKNVQPAQPVGLAYQIVGNACESILNVPDIQVEVCKVERMSEKNCKAKLVFVPIPSSPANNV